MIFLNIPVIEEISENRIEKIFADDSMTAVEPPPNEDETEEEGEKQNAESKADEDEPEENEIEKNMVTEEIEEEIEEVINEAIEEEIEEVINEAIEEEIEEVINEAIEEEIEEVINIPEAPNLPVEQPLAAEQPLVDDLLEFIPDAKPHITTLFDELIISKPEKKSLNDLLTERKDDNSLGTRFQQSHIPDLTKAIAINEKFTFIRELFRNNGVEFSNAIQKLNECSNIDDAFVLMEELKHQFIWDTTSSAYLTLCDLVRRRFLS
jgi:fused signal recognition particle receptor